MLRLYNDDVRVGLFITCLCDTFYPRAGEAMVRILEHLGCDVRFPTEQTCCGQPMFNNGLPDQTRQLAERMLDVFPDDPYVVSPSGSCIGMVHHYRHLFHHHPRQAECERLIQRSFEFVQFLTKVMKVDLAKLGCTWPGTVTYHYSCHLRLLGMTTQATDLLDQIDQLEYVPLNRIEQCCGFGGTFAVKYPEISGSMARDKARCIGETGAPVVVSNDSGCTMNIAGTCHREGIDVRFKHIAEIIAEGLGLMPRTDTPQTLAEPAK